MTTGFQQQRGLANFGFTRAEPKPQQVGRRLDPEARQPEDALPVRAPQEARAFHVLRA